MLAPRYPIFLSLHVLFALPSLVSPFLAFVVLLLIRYELFLLLILPLHVSQHRPFPEQFLLLQLPLQL